jgi:putative hemolysin
MDDLLFSYADENTPGLKRRVIRTVERLTGQPELKRIYIENRRHPLAGESFWSAAVRRLRLDVRHDAARLAALPKTGPLVIVANHPYGVLDGLVIAWLAERIRPDFKILTHAALLRAPEAAPSLLAVDFSGTPGAIATNLASRAAARDHLARGGCIIVFPAGGVSTSPDRLGRKPAQDAEWQPFTAQLIERARADVAPMLFEGQNSRVFQIASHFSLTLRLALIFHEVRSRIGATLNVAIGAPLSWDELAPVGDRKALLIELRRRTEALATDLPQAPGRHERDHVVKRGLTLLKAKLRRKRGGNAIRTGW